jgi:epoxyqueuosine reductase
VYQTILRQIREEDGLASQFRLVHYEAMDREAKSEWIVGRARELGFSLCGIAPAERFEELEHLDVWMARGFAGAMSYLEDPRRRDPCMAMPGARSVIVCALDYNGQAPHSTETATLGGEARGWLSRYAWGEDYHLVVKAKLLELQGAMRAQFGADFEARAYVDTGPVVERVAAKHAGLGWLAKNTCLINEDLGSWLFLGVILTSLDLAPTLRSGELPAPDLCGNCTLCLDACPTGAFAEPYVLDARRCISYLTIELRGEIPEEFHAGMGRMVFGCDICQDVCPWNNRAPIATVREFAPRAFPPPGTVGRESGGEEPQETLLAPRLEWLAALTEEEYREVFRHSAVKRTKWRGLLRNVCVALGNAKIKPQSSEGARVIALLERLAHFEDEVVAKHARLALGRLAAPIG